MDPIAAVVNAGISGAVIYTVRLFLDFIKTHNEKCNTALINLADAVNKQTLAVTEHTIALNNHVTNCPQLNGDNKCAHSTKSTM